MSVFVLFNVHRAGLGASFAQVWVGSRRRKRKRKEERTNFFLLFSVFFSASTYKHSLTCRTTAITTIRKPNRSAPKLEANQVEPASQPNSDSQWVSICSVGLRSAICRPSSFLLLESNKAVVAQALNIHSIHLFAPLLVDLLLPLRHSLK